MLIASCQRTFRIVSGEYFAFNPRKKPSDCKIEVKDPALTNQGVEVRNVIYALLIQDVAVLAIKVFQALRSVSII